MLLLTSTSDGVALTTSAATAVHVQASYVDMSGTTITPGRTNTIIAAATSTTVVAAPAASTQRNVKHLSIMAQGGAQTVTLTHTDGTYQVTLFGPVALLTGESVVFTDGSGFQTLDATGALKLAQQPQTGRWIKRTVLTSGSGSITTDPKTNSIRFVMVGGGSGGGGASTATTSAACGGGGGAASYLDKWVACSPFTSYSYVVGALGSGGSTSGGNGNTGTSSTLVVGATTYTAYNGYGGTGMVAGTTEVGAAGGGASVGGSNGDINGAGQPGELGWIRSGTLGWAGNGGSSAYGAGGRGPIAAGVGGAAVGYGGGGGGGCVLNGSTAVAGGAGTGGIIIVDEYC